MQQVVGEEGNNVNNNLVRITGKPTMLTAVGINKDKSSQHAVKWAIDHLLINTHNLILIHVQSKTPAFGFTVAEASPDATRQQIETENVAVFLPYRGFCFRKGITLTEVLLEDNDIPKAVNDYINSHHVHNFVVGTTPRSALTKKFRNADMASTLVKMAPDFCAVYVISRGKAVNVRSAKGPVPSNAVPLPNKQIAVYEDPPRGSSVRGNWREGIPPPLLPDQMKMTGSCRGKPPLGSHHESNEMHFRPTSHSVGYNDFSDDSDYALQSSDFSMCFEAPKPISDNYSNDGHGKRDLEAEMKRLKLELKQTMDMYSNACKEAITAKQKARELVQSKMEEARKFEESRSNEEAALAMAEQEKARAIAALEAAEAAQRKAQKEVQRRRYAELKAQREAEEKMKAWDVLAQNDVRYRKYDIKEIEFATDNLSQSMKIGEGGYGPVYKGCLDHTPVAIKVLKPDGQQRRKQFNQEVEVLSCIRHPNMVLLLGACPEYGCLVYEYMDNGSLEDRLMRRGNTRPIPWTVRFKISAEIATALLFLHQAKPEPIVHRDLKPANILLDRNFTSKISDVGLARLVPASVANSVTQYRMTSTAGTFCYIDPEYQQTGLLGCKSDIYSLGIMLLQIITGKPPMGITHHVENAIKNGTFRDMLDPTVKDWPVEECLQYAMLALKCAELRRKDRPDLGTVILPELNRLRNFRYSDESHNPGFSSSSYNSSDSNPGRKSGGHSKSHSISGGINSKSNNISGDGHNKSNSISEGLSAGHIEGEQQVR